MHSLSIGGKSADFYKQWALATEEFGQTKKADQIFLRGIEVGAEPLAQLKAARW